MALDLATVDNCRHGERRQVEIRQLSPLQKFVNTGNEAPEIEPISQNPDFAAKAEIEPVAYRATAHLLPRECREQISNWVAKEVASWTGFDPDTAQAVAELERFNQCNPEISVLEISGKEVTLTPKSNDFPNSVIEGRTNLYP